MKTWLFLAVGSFCSITFMATYFLFAEGETANLRSEALAEFQGDQEPAYFATDEREIGNRVNALMSESRSVEAKAILHEYLNQHPLNYRVRMDLALVLEWEGELESAVEELTKSLSGKRTDRPVYEMIASLRLSQANADPNQIDHGNFIEYRPSSAPSEADVKRRNDFLQKSLDARRMALQIDPNHEDNLLQVASILEELSKLEEADQTWKSLYELNATRDSIALGYSDSLLRNLQHDTAIEVLETAILANPRSESLYKKLAGVCNSAGVLDKAQSAQKVAEFYESLPDFCDLEYSEDLATQISKLHEESTVSALINDASLESSKLLATLCWHHPHDEHEERAFQELEKRGEEAIDVVVALVHESASTCTTRQAMRILAKAKHPKAYDWLIRLLRQDTMNFGFDMDIAGSLAHLSDPRAVPHLIQIFAPEEAMPKPGDHGMGWLEDIAPARARAALALSAFDTQESKEALNLGVKHPTFGPCCNAALYKLTNDASYLEHLKPTEVDTRIAWTLLNFLRSLPEQHPKTLADQIEAHLEQTRQQSEPPQK